MPLAAITKVQNAIIALSFAARPDLSVLPCLPSGEAIAEIQLPALVITMVTDEFENSEYQSSILHRVTVRFEFLSGLPTLGAIDAFNQQGVADVYADIAADRSLGGMLEDFEIKISDGTETSAPDVGSAVMQGYVLYHTPRANLYDIIGANGATF